MLRFLFSEVYNVTSSPPTLGATLLVFAAYYLGLAIVLNLILWALETYADFTMDTNAIGMLPLIIGAMQAGQRYGMQTGKKPPGGYSWVASLLFIIVSTVLGLALAYGLLAAQGLNPMELLNAAIVGFQQEGISVGLMAGIIGGVMLLLWLLTRFAFGFGAGTGAKLAARQKG
jgi:hypothetical protein